MSGLVDFLAGAGQMYGGYRANEEQLLQMERARQQQEQAELELKNRRRAEAYQAKVEGGLSDFMTGAQANTITTPGKDAVIPATAVDDEGNAMPVDMGTATTRKEPNMTGALEYMHRAALESAMPDKADALRKQLHAYKNEGVEEMARAILGGKSDDEIRDVLNSKGNFNAARVQRVSDTEVIGVSASGKPFRYDAKNAMRSMLGPDKYFSTQTAEGELERRRVDDATKREIEEKYKGVLGEAATTRANAYKAASEARAQPKPPKPVDPAKERAERRKFNSDVTRYAEKDATGYDTDGNPVVDKELANQITGLSILMAQEDPDLLGDPRMATMEARARLDELRSKAKFKAGREWDGAEEGGGHAPGTFEGFTTATGKEGKEAYIKRRAKEITDGLLKSARTTVQGSNDEPSPPPAASTAPKKITSDAERDALPSGTLYIDPQGKLRRKA